MNESSKGSLIGSIIVVIILIIGAIFLYTRRAPSSPTPTPANETVTTTAGDDVASLQADAQAAAVGNLDDDLGALDQEFAK